MMKKIRILSEKNKFFRKMTYIAFRIYSLLYSFLFVLMKCVPVRENRIVGCNMKGKRYGDNPKYIIDRLLEKNSGLDIVWLADSRPEEPLPEGVRYVKNSVWNQVRELSAAKVWIDSNTKQFGFLKRKNQLYMQTWHGSYGLKKVYGDIPDKISVFDKVIIRYNFDRTDITVSNAAQTTEIFRRAFWYNGPFIEEGSPRNDIFFEDGTKYEEKVRKHFHLKDERIVLYAPTFRKDMGLSKFDIDFDVLREALSAAFGGPWTVLVRLHPNNISQAEAFTAGKKGAADATGYDLMQELLVASDVLVTDYSSCMFDFATTGKPCFLYASDAREYREERDYYFEPEELPFPLAADNGELDRVIRSFDEKKYASELKALFAKVGLNETGRAGRAAADYILDWMKTH